MAGWRRSSKDRAFPDSGKWRKGLSPWGAVPMEALENSLGGEGVRSIRVPWDTQDAVKQVSGLHVLSFEPASPHCPERGRKQRAQESDHLGSTRSPPSPAAPPLWASCSSSLNWG